MTPSRRAGRPAARRVEPAVKSEGIHAQERRLRDAITIDITYRPDEGRQAQARAALDAYLSAHGRNQTAERLMVLYELCGIDQPVDIDTLLRLIVRDQGQMSRTSVYNTLALLADARLVRRLDLIGGGMDFYECVVGEEPHGYAVCRRCGTWTRLPLAGESLPGIDALPKGFVCEDCKYVVLGLCRRCARKRK